MDKKIYNFKGKDIDEVLKALKKANKEILAVDLHKEYLTDWQAIKVDDIYNYLYTTYKHRFIYTEPTDFYDLFLGYTDYWDDVLEKGGFEKYWEHTEKIKTSLKEVLNTTNLSIDLIEKITKIALGYFIT